MIYRVKQVIWAITAKITTADKVFVDMYLTDHEQQLFYALKRYEQKHSIHVAQAMYQEWVAREDEAVVQTETVIRLGLLHDIGKSVYPMGVIGKTLMVLGDNITKGQLQKHTRCKMVKCYYQHPQLGYERLKPYLKDELFLQLILRHHDTVTAFKASEINEADKAVQLMALLQKWDNTF